MSRRLVSKSRSEVTSNHVINTQRHALQRSSCVIVVFTVYFCFALAFLTKRQVLYLILHFYVMYSDIPSIASEITALDYT